MNELERNVREHSRARPRSDRIEIGQSGGHGGATSSKHARGVTSPPLGEGMTGTSITWHHYHTRSQWTRRWSGT